MNQPGIVRAEFVSAVSLDVMMTLDGLLSALIIREPTLREESRNRRFFHRLKEEHGEEYARRYFQERDWQIPTYTHLVPLASWGHGLVPNLWVLCASYGIPDEPWEYDTSYWTRRTDSEQVLRWLDEGPKRIEVGKGPYKAYHMPVPLIVTAGLTWHVRGDLAEIRKILEAALYIGKKRAQGHGRVKRWVVEPEAEDRSVWDGDELMRPIPRELLEAAGIQGEFEYGYYGFRPPYHDVRNLAECALRGKRYTQNRDVLGQKGICEVKDLAWAVENAFGSGADAGKR